MPPAEGRRREAPSYDRRRRWIVLGGSLFFIAMALTGVGWFFQDQVRTVWRQGVAYFQKPEADPAGELDPAVQALLEQVKSPSPPAKQGTAAAPTVPQPSGKPATQGAPKPAPPVKDDSAPADKPVESVKTSPPAPAPAPAPAPVITTNTTPVPPPARKPETAPAAPTPAPKAEAIPDTSVRKALPADPPSPAPKPGAEPPSKLDIAEPPAPPRPENNSNALVEVAPTPAKPGAASPSSAATDSVFVRVSAEVRPAAEALQKFFAAGTWQERLELTQTPERMRPLMERYYASNPDGPLRTKSIELLRHDKAPETGSPLCVFQVAGPDVPEPLPVMVESTPAGWKVDWLAFTEFKDKLLFRYLEKWQDEPGRFHVMVRRTHYFDDDVPDLERKHCFELMPPTPGYSGFGFVPKGTPLAHALDRAIGWEMMNIAAVVELQWRKRDGYQWVEITAVPQFNWRSSVVPMVAEPAKALPVEPEEIPVARPAESGKPPAVAGKK